MTSSSVQAAIRRGMGHVGAGQRGQHPGLAPQHLVAALRRCAGGRRSTYSRSAAAEADQDVLRAAGRAARPPRSRRRAGPARPSTSRGRRSRRARPSPAAAAAPAVVSLTRCSLAVDGPARGRCSRSVVPVALAPGRPGSADAQAARARARTRRRSRCPRTDPARRRAGSGPGVRSRPRPRRPATSRHRPPRSR